MRDVLNIDTSFFVQCAGKFEALTLAAQKRAQSLTESRLIQTHVAYALQFADDFLDVEIVEHLFNTHCQPTALTNRLGTIPAGLRLHSIALIIIKKLLRHLQRMKKFGNGGDERSSIRIESVLESFCCSQV
jgi:hypothetical protein